MTEEQLKNAAAPEDPGEAPAGEPVVEETAGKTAGEPTVEETAGEAAEKEPSGEADSKEKIVENVKTAKVKAELKKARAELAEAQKAAAEAEAKAAAQQDQYTRLYAEYENFRRRSVKEKEDMYAAATADALTALLPLLDNLQRAAAYTEGEKVIEGVHMILGSLPDVLTRMNVTAFGARGDAFDPNLHNAVMQAESDELPSGTIADVLQCGYKFGDKIIRHAMVAVVA